ncbi:MAG: gamma carbonic anhydrase family protein [bacterium]
MGIRSFNDKTPEIADSAYVDETATIIGDVTVREHASIWPGAVLRGDLDSIVIGPAANIQDNAVCHTDPGYTIRIGSRVTVGHGAVIHGATVDSNSIIGMNSTLLNGSTIGPHCLIAAGSVVVEDQNIPAESMATGTPATVKKSMDPDSDLFESGSHYVELADAYKS